MNYSNLPGNRTMLMVKHIYEVTVFSSFMKDFYCLIDVARLEFPLKIMVENLLHTKYFVILMCFTAVWLR